MFPPDIRCASVLSADERGTMMTRDDRTDQAGVARAAA
jgi:hypothetical protein